MKLKAPIQKTQQDPPLKWSAEAEKLLEQNGYEQSELTWASAERALNGDFTRFEDYQLSWVWKKDTPELLLRILLNNFLVIRRIERNRPKRNVTTHFIKLTVK